MTNFITSGKLACLESALQSGTDAFARSMLLRRLLNEAEKPCRTRQQLDTRERQLAEVRQLIYRQVQLVENDRLESHEAEQVQNLLATLNQLMAHHQMLRRTITAAE